MFDYLIVGAGFSGCVLAERIASQMGKTVLLVETADQIGGICFDYRNERGVLVHGCGLHVVHTNSHEVWEYLSKFTGWVPRRTEVGAEIDGKVVAFPFNRDGLNALFGLDLRTPADVEAYLDRVREPIANPRNAEEMALSQIGRPLYEKFFRGYTIKWWGRDPKEIDPRVTSRIVIRGDNQANYQNDTYQGVPAKGYSKLFERLVDHPLITVQTGTDYRSLVGKVSFGKLIYTGAIDDFFDHAHGRLPYRTMRFEEETLDVDYFLPCHQVVYPNDHEYMRIFEFKQATRQNVRGTTIIKEYPMDTKPGMRRDYPLPLVEAEGLYRKYREDADKLDSVLFLGRLAQYRYFTMGQTVARALTVFKTKVQATQVLA